MVPGGALALVRKAAAVVCPRFFFRRIMATQKPVGPLCVISFDCDFPRDIEVLPALVQLLRRYEIPASFACIGQWVRRFPDEHKLLVDSGFEILNHTDTHPNLYHPNYDYARGEDLNREFFNAISPEERRREIEGGHAAIVEVLGCQPTGYRTPHFGSLHVDDIYPVLSELGYVYSSSVLAAERGCMPYCTQEGLWELPVSPCPQHPFGVLDSWHSLGKSGSSHAGCGDLAALFAELVDAVIATSGIANVYFDPKDVLESGELERIIQVLSECDIQVADCRELVAALGDGADSVAVIAD